MKIFITIISFAFFIFSSANSQIKRDPKGIFLIIRADDIASSQAANEAVIKTYLEGITKSTEIMVPSPWFLEAAKLLRENPGLDVGVHLVLTSEWENIKWRPLTYSPSLVDSNGYFFPQVWKNKNFPAKASISENNWNLQEIEKELRAQIEMAKKHIPQLSHISEHMGFSGLDSKIMKLTQKLAKEYGLDIQTDNVKYFDGFNGANNENENIPAFINNLKNMKPGVYIFVEHPSLNTPEMKHTGHVGYYNVSSQRQNVTDLFTNPDVIATIKEKKIQLISYADLPKLK